MKFPNYFHETASKTTRSILKSYDNPDHKIAIWNAFVDSELSGVTDDDFSILPRLIPASYFPVIEKTCRDITAFTLKLLSLPEAEVRAIIPRGPVRDLLINEIKVLKHQPKRLTGSYRFDMAVVGPPTAAHPPQLLEINEIGFDGLARSSFFQKTLLELMPDLKKHVISLDTAKIEVNNMRRLGTHIARLQYDCYNWDEEYLRLTAEKMGSKITLISPTQYKNKIDEKDFPLLEKKPFVFRDGKIWIGDESAPDALNFSFAFDLADYVRDQDFYAQLVAAKTPQYGPLITGLIASKSILILLNDPSLRRKLLGSAEKLKDSILPAFTLEGNTDIVQDHAKNLVIKHVDGFGGQQVFMDQEMLRKVARVPSARQHEWVVQQKTKLNTIDVNGVLSRRKRAIADLGVFVHYDWQDGKFLNFKVGGLMTRATNKSLKVNVSSGGLQAAVLLDRSC